MILSGLLAFGMYFAFTHLIDMLREVRKAEGLFELLIDLESITVGLAWLSPCRIAILDVSPIAPYIEN